MYALAVHIFSKETYYCILPQDSTQRDKRLKPMTEWIQVWSLFLQQKQVTCIHTENQLKLWRSQPKSGKLTMGGKMVAQIDSQLWDHASLESQPSRCKLHVESREEIRKDNTSRNRVSIPIASKRNIWCIDLVLNGRRHNTPKSSSWLASNICQ